jgi:hypothetical protein
MLLNEERIGFYRRYAYSLLKLAHVYTLGSRLLRNRRVVEGIAHELGFRDGPLALPQVALADLLGNEMEVCLCEPIPHPMMNVSLLELIVLTKLVKLRRPRRMFEIGTFDGRTALNLAANAAEDAEVFTLDLPPGARAQAHGVPEALFESRYRGTRWAARIRQLHGDSQTFDFHPYEDTIDLVFVDGSHQYEHVVHDSHAALQLRRQPGGAVVWHDYGARRGVTQALNELSAGPAAGLHHIEGTSLAFLAG